MKGGCKIDLGSPAPDLHAASSPAFRRVSVVRVPLALDKPDRYDGVTGATGDLRAMAAEM